MAASTIAVLCSTCKVEFKGRNPQIVPCFVCKEYVHRTCLPETLTSTDYVRMKKFKEAFELECCSCFARKHGTTSPSIVSKRKRQAAVKKTTESPSKRRRQLPVVEPPKQTSTSVRAPPARPRPTAIFLSSQEKTTQLSTRPGEIVLSSRKETRVVVTSTPLDELLPSPIDHINQLQPSITISHLIVITPSDHQQLVDWSSRYEIPIPLREDTVELRQRAVAPMLPAAPLVPYDSSDEEDVPEEPFKWHIVESALRRLVCGYIQSTRKTFLLKSYFTGERRLCLMALVIPLALNRCISQILHLGGVPVDQGRIGAAQRFFRGVKNLFLEKTLTLASECLINP